MSLVYHVISREKKSPKVCHPPIATDHGWGWGWGGGRCGKGSSTRCMCKIFLSLFLVQHARFHGKKKMMMQIFSSTKKSKKTTDSIKAKKLRKMLNQQDCERLEEKNTKNKQEAGTQSEGIERSKDERPEERVRRSSRKTKGINRKYDTPQVTMETTGDDVDDHDDDEFIPEKSEDVENDDDDDGIPEEVKEEEIDEKKYSPRKARKGNYYALFTHNVCIYVYVKHQEWVLWQQKMGFTLNIFV